MNKTKIEWVKNPDGTQGYTWNPITGCLNHVNGFCIVGGFPCYAYKLANGRLKQRYLANDDFYVTTPWGEALARRDPFYPRFWPNRWLDLRWQATRGIFVCDMGELFGDWIPKEWQAKVFDYIKCYPKCRFYLLTKQPQNLPKFSPFPENCWVGVTVTNGNLYKPAIQGLATIEAKVKYISFEPLLENPNDFAEQWAEGLEGIDWVIIGAQTNPYKPPKIEWVEEIVRTCDKAGIPVFLKDNLEPLFEAEREEGGPPLLRFNKDTWELRQEMPIE